MLNCRDMMLDTDNTPFFEAPCDFSSESFFSINYISDVDGWHLKQYSKHRKITTKTVNIYNYHINMEELEVNEKNSLYPPRFVLNVVKKPGCTKDLDTDIMVSLYDQENGIKSQRLKVFVSVPPCQVKAADASILEPLHHDNCKKASLTLKDLVVYSNQISMCWKDIAIQLGVPRCEIAKIDSDNTGVVNKCFELFVYLLKYNPSVCWCHFIKALKKVGLYQVAEEAEHKYLGSQKKEKNCSNTSTRASISLQDLMKYLNLIPDINLHFFVYYLLSKQSALKVIQDIRCSDGSKEDNIRKICDAFLKEENPTLMKILRALREADCCDLADIIENHFLKNSEDI